jgi:hypothetical protein
MMNALEATVSDFVIPIYGLNQDRQVFGIGSGVVIRWTSGEYVLVTVGHVLDWYTETSLLTWGGPTGFIPLADRGAVTTVPAGRLRGADKTDLAAVLLDRDTVLRIKRTDARFARHEVIWREAALLNGFYSFMGYPNETNEIVAEPDASGRLVRTKPRQFVSFRVRPAPALTYRRVGCDPDRHFVGVFDHRQLYENGQPVLGPHPRGISGGGVFFLGSTEAVYHGRSRPRLIGIGIEYHSDEYLIVATKSLAVVAAIDHRLDIA